MILSIQYKNKTTHRISVNSRNNRLASPRDPIPFRQKVPLDALRVSVVQHLLDVGAGRERLLAARDDDRSDAVVGLEFIQGLGHLRHKAIAEGVQGFGAVKGDQAYVVFSTRGLGFDVLVCRGWKMM